MMAGESQLPCPENHNKHPVTMVEASGFCYVEEQNLGCM